MELLNRYLHAVRFWLPKAQQEDIIAELREDLSSQIEDRESQLGHPLDEDGLAELLRQRGNPMLVAAHYLPQRSLIGPTLFPIYGFILRLVILWVMAPVFILVVGPATILASRNPSAALIETVWTMLMAAVFAFGTITLIFAIFERYPHPSLLKWDPRKLPRVPANRGVTQLKPVTGFAAIAELLASLGAGIAWADIMWHRTTFHMHDVVITLAPVTLSFFWPVLLVAFSGVPAGLVGWLRPWQWKVRTYIRLAADGITLILTGALATMGPWVTVTAAHMRAEELADANHWTNAGISIGIAFAAIMTLLDGGLEVRRLLQRKPNADPAPVAVQR